MKDFMDFYSGSFGKTAGAQPQPAPQAAAPAPGPAAPAAAMIPPEANDQTTAVTCDSACKYAQNPEKRCMLGSVTYTQSEDGSFMCSQYSPAPEALQVVQQASQAAQSVL